MRHSDIRAQSDKILGWLATTTWKLVVLTYAQKINWLWTSMLYTTIPLNGNALMNSSPRGLIPKTLYSWHQKVRNVTTIVLYLSMEDKEPVLGRPLPKPRWKWLPYTPLNCSTWKSLVMSTKQPTLIRCHTWQWVNQEESNSDLL